MHTSDPPAAYKTLFGPVMSRRLGLSLGVDLVPHKTCSMDCVYCECGATTHLTLARREYVAVDRVREELTAFLSRGERIDYVTFSGSGEPTLNEGIGEIIRFLKTEHPRLRIALLTNSSLFDQPLVRNQLRGVDVVMASLDAATAPRFARVNRPHPGIDLQAMIAGIADFRKTFPGRLVIEYFVVPGCNDASDELTAIKRVLARIDAHGVVVNNLDRPATEPWVRPAAADRLKVISDFFEGADIVTYGSPRPSTGAGHEDLLVRLVETVRRRPTTAQDVARVVGLDIGTVQSVLDQLVASGRLAIRHMERGIFYVAS